MNEMVCKTPDVEIGYITDAGRVYRSRSVAEGMSFKFIGFTVGCGGFQDADPWKVDVKDGTLTDLRQHYFPADLVEGTHNPEPFDKIEYTSNGAVAFYARLDTDESNVGWGELGVWAEIIYSPDNPGEVGTRFLFALVQSPMKAKTSKTVMVTRAVFI